MLQNKLQERLAAGSLLLVILVPAFFTALIMGFEANRMRVNELDYMRARRAAGEYALAHYDLDLWLNFRIWAGQEVEGQETVEKLLPKLPETSLKIKPDRPAFEPEDLKQQITKLMQERLPLVVLNGLTDRLRLFADNNRQVNQLAQASLAESEPGIIDQLSQFRDLELSESETSQNPGQETGRDWVLAKRLIESLFGDLDDHKRYLLTTYSSDLTQELPLDSLESLAGFANMAESYSEFAAGLGMEKLLIIEYIMAYFPAKVTQRDHNGKLGPLRRLDGLDHVELRKKYPQNYAEMILTGLDSELAAKRVEYYILGLRLINHYSWLNTDSAQKQKYLTYAGLISGLISLVSLGSINLPPEGIAQLLIFARACKDAYSDLVNLKHGRGVQFWPGKGRLDFEIYYHDFLRVFFLAKSETDMLHEIGQQLRQLFPEARQAGYTVDSNFRSNQTQSFTVAYLDKFK